jgi:hypothetical protein
MRAGVSGPVQALVSRITSIALLLGGAALIVTWIVSPASSAPQTPTAATPSAGTDSSAGAPIDVAPVRLPDAGAPPPEYRVPVRNPFAFSAPERSRADDVGLPEVPAAPPSPVLPSLVAIMTDSTTEGDVRRAALASSSGVVQIVRAGESFGPFTVSEIAAGALALEDTTTGLTYRLSLH